MDNCELEDNKAYHSGSTYCESHSSIEWNNTLFVHNYAVIRGVLSSRNCFVKINGCSALADLGGVPGARPPMGPNSFVFIDIFTRKCPRWRSTPLMGTRPPAGNPGSATVL